MAIATLSIDLVAKIASFEKDLQRAATASEAQSKRMALAFDFVKGAIVGMAGALAVGSFSSSIKSIADYGDELAKMSQRVGVSTEALSGLALAASYSDVSNEQLATGLKKLSQTMSEAAAGNERYQKILKALGTSETKDVNKAFREIADRMSELKDGAGKTALMMAGFGKAGADLIPLMNGGAKAIDEATDQAERFGLVVDEKASKAAERFNDNLTEMEKRAQGLKVALLGGLIPFINRMYDDIKGLGSIGEKFDLLSVISDVQKFNKELKGLEERKALSEKSPLKFNFAVDIDKQIAKTTANLKAAQAKFKLMDVGRQNAIGGGSGNVNPASVTPQKEDVNVDFLSTGSSKVGKAKAEAIDDTARSLASYVDGLGRAVEQTQNLTETEKALQFLRSQGAAGEVPQVRALVLGLAEQIDKDQELIEVRKQSAAYFDGLAKDQATLEESNQKLRDQVAEIGLNKQALEALTLARMDNNIAQEQSNLAIANAAGANQEEIVLMERKIKLLQEQRALTNGGQISQGLADTAAEQEKKSNEFADTLQSDVKNALSNAFRDTNDPIAAFGDSLGNIVFTRVANGLADAILGSSFGGSGGGGFSLASLLSFDGGGYTGSGARAGGVDGKGGFLAMMHPNETVIDHTKGQSGGSTVNHYNFTVGDVASKTMVMQAISNAQKQSAAVVNRSNRYA